MLELREVPLDITFHHSSFPVRDLERSRRFYGGILGLTEIDRPDIFAVAGAWYLCGATEVHLVEIGDDEAHGQAPSFPHPGARHAAFAVADHSAAIELLRGHGLSVIQLDPGIAQCWIQDPDGHVIEILTPSAAADQ